MTRRLKLRSRTKTPSKLQELNPVPGRASGARRERTVVRRRRSISPSSSVPEEVPDLLTSTGGVLEGKWRGSRALSPKTERLKDANFQPGLRVNSGQSSLIFHCRYRAARCLCRPTTAALQRAQIFVSRRFRSRSSFDRRSREPLHPNHSHPRTPTLQRSFPPKRNEHSLDRALTVLLRLPPILRNFSPSPCGLCGTTFTDEHSTDVNPRSPPNCAFSPIGDILAVAGRRGYSTWWTGRQALPEAELSVV